MEHTYRNSRRLLILIITFVTILIGLTQISRAQESTDIYPYRHNIKEQHSMRVLNSGVAALWARIDMIRRAQTSLELEYFIFNPDTAGRIIMREMVAAADRGVKVRLLIDKSKAVFVLDDYYAEVLAKKGIEVRYYNGAPLIWISTIQFRNHRKLIVRDGLEAIVGGRNIADEYFDLSPKFNFLDRDIWVEGKIVTTMVESFNSFWDNEIVEQAGTPRKPHLNDFPSSDDGDDYMRVQQYQQRLKSYNKQIAAAASTLVASAEEREVLKYVVSYGPEALGLTNQRSCPHVAFATDRAGATFIRRLNSNNYHKNYRYLRKEIRDWMDLITTEVTFDSPYLLNNSRSRKILFDLLERGVQVNFLTNSLASTDAIYVSTVFSQEVKRYREYDKLNTYIYKGDFSEESELISDQVREAVWGTHSKTIIFSKDAFMIGTFNIDNRSSFYNTELAIFCQGSKELRDDVMANVELRMKGAKKLGPDGQPEDGTPLLEGTSLSKKALYFLLKVPATILKFLL